jgi:branched-chain amino acid transport system permease protein
MRINSTTAAAEAPDTSRRGPLRRDALGAQRRTAVNAVGTCAFLLVAVGVYLGGSGYTVFTFSMVAIFGLVAVSQEWLVGRAGQISLGAAAIMAVGAYTVYGVSGQPWAVFPIPLIMAALSGAAIGLVVGIPGVRFTGIYLMLSTLALQELVSFAGQWWQGLNYQGGFPIASPSLVGADLSSAKSFFLVTVIILGIALLALRGIYRSPAGRGWEAMRQSEIAASTLGVHNTRWKLVAFVGSSAMTAVGGALFGYLNNSVSYTNFTLDVSITLLLMVFIGGTGTLTGPLLGAVIIVYFPIEINRLTQLFPANSGAAAWVTAHEAVLADIAYGLMLMIVLLLERGGAFGLGARLLRLMSRMWQRRRGGHGIPALEGHRDHG